MARQALAATPQIIETAGCIGSRLTSPDLYLATLIHECHVLELLKQQRQRLNGDLYRIFQTFLAAS